MRAKTYFLMCVLLAISCTHAAATVIYVDDDANGLNNGTSWENAYTYLQDALAAAPTVVLPVEIRIAQGTYKPDLGTGFTQADKEATFQLINKVNLVGGYAGLGQTDPNLRDIELYETILSGDLNNNDIIDPNASEQSSKQSRSDNSYRVITSRYIHNSTSIDGLTITGGNANDTSYQTGGGMYNYYSDLIINNCTFKNNSAYNGAGVFNYFYSPKYTNCKFIENTAENNGGGIYNSRASITLTNCTINKNTAKVNGGGMYNNYDNSILKNCTISSNMAKSGGGGIFNEYSNLNITDCLFNSNQSVNDGGGLYNYYSKPVLSNCTFNENTSSDGGGIYNDSQSNASITSCTFKTNHAKMGGAMYNYHSSNPVITSCIFSENKADSSGGGTYNNNSAPTIINCTYTGNISYSEGGGIRNASSSNPTITNCSFMMNSSSFGGGICNYSSCNPTITDCSFIGNEVTSNGGGIQNSYQSNPKVINCLFSRNLANGFGGGMFNYSSSSPTITNCIFSENESKNLAGGIYNQNSCNPNINECTFIKNMAKDHGGGMYNYDSNPTLTNCTFRENMSENQGGGMFNNKSNPSLTNCTFRKNNASSSGGGIYNESSDISSIKMCILIENIAGVSGGAMYNDKCTAKLPNSIFLGNSALYGGAINNTDNSNISLSNCIFEGNLSLYGDAISCSLSTEPGDVVSPGIVKLSNCIFCDESKEIYNDSNSIITVAYCDIKNDKINSYDPNEKIVWSDGNIEIDPCFARPGYWNLNQTPEDANDDFYTEGDYHLKSQAGRYDPNSQSWVTDNVTSLCIDAGAPLTPLYYEPNPNGNRINIGVYAGTFEASKSLYDNNYFSQAYSPKPINGLVGAYLDPILDWLSDSNVIEHEVYFGTDEFPPFFRKQNATEFDPGALQPYTQYYWRIDDLDNLLNRVSGNIWTFTTGPVPGYPYNPNPRNGAENVQFGTILSWNPGINSNYSRYYYYHDFYIGTDFNDVYNATVDNPLGVQVIPYAYGRDANYYNPTNLKSNQTYYWRVDEIITNRPGALTTKGNVWSFTTGPKPEHIYNPSPANNALDVLPEAVSLSWSPGTITPDTYDVYFGTKFNDVNNASITNPLGCLVSIAQDANYYDLGQLDYYYSTYYWRVDEADSNGLLRKGEIWSFNTFYYSKDRECFPADTPVWVNNKMVEISKVTSGQIIGKADSAMSISGSVQGLKEHRPGVNACYVMTLESGNTITIVHSHYFKTVSGEWKKIEELSAGMQLQSMNGPITIKSVIKKEKPFLDKSYNIITEGSEQYFVGIDGVVALDCSKKTWEILEEARK